MLIDFLDEFIRGKRGPQSRVPGTAGAGAARPRSNSYRSGELLIAARTGFFITAHGAAWHPAQMPFTVDRAALQRYSVGLDREVALDLEGALSWLGADEDQPSISISRHDLQQFVHYFLPRKFLVSVEEHIAVARALGDALEHLGAADTYAELCRSPETVALLRLWEVDEDAAFAKFAAFTDASGLEPPDVEELQWQGMMGMAEASTRDAATLALERSAESGDPRPAAEIVRSVLAEPDPDGAHPTRLAAVQAERINRWAGWRDTPRRAMLEPLLGELAAAPEPEWPADDVFDWLLCEARTGLALTERGALSRAIVVEVGQRRPQWTWGKPPRSEAEIDHLERLHAALRGSGLVRKHNRKLLATKLAGRLSPGARRVHLLTRLLGGDAFRASVAELTLAALAQGFSDVTARVEEAIVADGWNSGGGPLPAYAVPSTVTDVRYVLVAIGAAEGSPLSLRGDCLLTTRGRAAVLCALRSHAMRPAPAPELLAAPQPPPGVHADRISAALPPVAGGAPPHLDNASQPPAPRSHVSGRDRRTRRKAHRAARRRNRR